MYLVDSTLISSDRYPFHCKSRIALLVVCGFFFSLLQACSNTASQQSNKNAAQDAIGFACGSKMRMAMDATSRSQYEFALQTLLIAKNGSCPTQLELASVDQLLSSTYLLLGDYESALNHLTLAIDRKVLEARLQQKSLYKAAQVSYLLKRSRDALDYMTQYQDSVAEMQPGEHVLMARCLYAAERHDEAFGIMINLYAKHRSGEIVMKQEWIDFLRGMEAKQEASLS